jgi:hypothetical protein
MSDLGSFFKLPTLSGSDLPQAKISYSLADTTKLLNEGFDKIKGSLGDNVTGAFSKLTANSPTFAKLNAGALFSGLKLGTPSTGPKLGDAASAVKLGTATDTATSIKENNTTEDAQGGDSAGHKVSLTASAADGESIAVQNDVNFPVEPLMERRVEFDMMPEVSEVRSVEYEPLSAPQMPGEFQKYKGTKSTQWNVTGTFTCRTRAEAYRNYVYMNNLRGWTMPYFGENQRLQFGDGGGRGKLGAPPPVLQFKGWRGLVGAVPVILTQLSWTWPPECDWIPTGIQDENGQEIPFPTVMRVQLNLLESFSPDQMNNFDLVAFRNGRMIGAWMSTDSTANTPPEVAEATGGNQSAVQGTAQPSGTETRSSAEPSTTYSNEGKSYDKAVATDVVPASASGTTTTKGVDADGTTYTIRQAAPPSQTSQAPVATGPSENVIATRQELQGQLTLVDQDIALRQKQATAISDRIARESTSQNASAEIISTLNSNLTALNNTISVLQSKSTTISNQLSALS